MITVQGLTLHFGQRPMFDDISFFIGSEDRIGLVGRNGAGKSTLLKIMAGQQPFDKGTIGKPKELTMGYLPQEMAHNLTLTAHLNRLVDVGFPVLFGASRKRMIAGVDPTATDPGDRIGGSVALALAAAGHGARMIRVHDVRETVQALRLQAALLPD